MTYASPGSHRSMVFDAVRNSAYARAIVSLVRPDSVVLDLGAGTGILGLLAAKAGARKVYLVEPQPLVRMALPIARANGIEDRIVIIQGRLEDITLPEPVDLILSVCTGNLLFSEDLLPSLFLARDRYLKPGGRLIPDRAQLWLAPVADPDLHQRSIGQWSLPASGLDVSAMRAMAANEIQWPARDEHAPHLLTSGCLMADVDLMTATNAFCQCVATCMTDHEGLCHGLLAWIRLQTGEDWLSTHPADEPMHWSNAVLPLDPPLQLAAGEKLFIELLRPKAGDWTWSLRAKAGQRLHSEFLARINEPARLRRAGPEFRPLHSAHGKAAAWILQRMDGRYENRELLQGLVEHFPGLFASTEDATPFLHNLLEKHAALPEAKT